MRRTENGCLVPVDGRIFNIGRLGTPCLPQKRASGREVCVRGYHQVLRRGFHVSEQRKECGEPKASSSTICFIYGYRQKEARKGTTWSVSAWQHDAYVHAVCIEERCHVSTCPSMRLAKVSVALGSPQSMQLRVIQQHLHQQLLRGHGFGDRDAWLDNSNPFACFKSVIPALRMIYYHSTPMEMGQMH